MRYRKAWNLLKTEMQILSLGDHFNSSNWVSRPFNDLAEFSLKFSYRETVKFFSSVQACFKSQPHHLNPSITTKTVKFELRLLNSSALYLLWIQKRRTRSTQTTAEMHKSRIYAPHRTRMGSAKTSFPWLLYDNSHELRNGKNLLLLLTQLKMHFWRS